MKTQTRLLIVGSAAGGGFPQWNCNCDNCASVRQGDPALKPRTQSSVAWSRDGEHWLLINASPDILMQVQRCRALHPKQGKRDTGISAVMLMDAQIDHVTGLVMLRENAHPMPLHATSEVLEELATGFPLTGLLSHYCGLDLHPIRTASKMGDSHQYEPLSWPWLARAHIEVQPLHSKPPPYSPWRNKPRPGDNVGVTLVNEQTGKRLFYAPGLGQLDDATWRSLKAADIVLVDGTFWRDDEMLEQGLGKKTARQMGHLPLSGPDGMLEALKSLPASTRKVLVHINNSNPILRDDSAERQALSNASIEVAFDTMEIEF